LTTGKKIKTREEEEEEEKKKEETVHSNSNKPDMSVCLSIDVYRREKECIEGLC
jgi:hypothetical protein